MWFPRRELPKGTRKQGSKQGPKAQAFLCQKPGRQGSVHELFLWFSKRRRRRRGETGGEARRREAMGERREGEEGGEEGRERGEEERSEGREQAKMRE